MNNIDRRHGRLLTSFTEKCDLLQITKLNFAYGHSESIGSLLFDFGTLNIDCCFQSIILGEP